MQKAFTLVELAIVLIIIGLITGGVVGAQSLIKSAKRQDILKQINNLQTAFQAYTLEFDDIPGDHKDAYNYFNGNTKGCGLNDDNVYQGCNGDGDKCIGSLNGSCTVSTYMWGDVRRFFMHLHLSEIMPKMPYANWHSSALTLSNDVCQAYGVNAYPITSFENVTFIANSKTSNVHRVYFFTPGQLYHSGTACHITSYQPAFTPQDMKYFEKKMDDNNGRLGRIRAVHNAQTDSYSGTNCQDSDGNYNLSYTESSCGLRFNLNNL